MQIYHFDLKFKDINIWSTKKVQVEIVTLLTIKSYLAYTQVS